MQIVLNPDFEAHEGQGEFHQGRLMPCFESPPRLVKIVAALRERGAEFVAPVDHGIDPILAVHDPAYVDLLRTVHRDWLAQGNEGDILPWVWPGPGMRSVDHDDINAKVGAHAFSSDTPITAGTWKAAYQGAQTALTALDRAGGAAFALTRPPGHHAQARVFGGYSYLNNAAIVAQAALEAGRDRVCVLDVDFHHGNGTQDIFYGRGDVLTVSIHGDPRTSFPYFSGYEDEIGEGAGEGANLNLPMPAGTVFADWSRTLILACERIARFAPELVVVPLGVDTFEGDPISSFALRTPDYLEMGRMLASLGLATVITMEGGYDVGPIGENVANVLEGFEDG